jgi:hypothetical protein
MKQQYDKQEISQLLSKFMAGATSTAEEEVLAQYFRTHEVDDEWAEYKEMFALFDNGEVDIELKAETSDQPNKDDNGKIIMLPKTVREKPKIAVLKWLMAGIAASIILLVVFHLGRSTAEQPSLVAESNVTSKDSVQPKHNAVTPTQRTEETVVAQAPFAEPHLPHAKTGRTVTSDPDAASTAEDLADCIARLEAEMESLDDSVNSAQVERLIAADARLQQMVNRIVGKQAELAMNEIQNDSTTNYVSF